MAGGFFTAEPLGNPQIQPQVPLKSKPEEDLAQTEEGKAMRHGGQNGVMQPQVKEDRQPQMLEERVLKGVGPCRHLDFYQLMSTSDFQPPELTESVSDICGDLLLWQLSNN